MRVFTDVFTGAVIHAHTQKTITVMEKDPERFKEWMIYT